MGRKEETTSEPLPLGQTPVGASLHSESYSFGCSAEASSTFHPGAKRLISHDTPSTWMIELYTYIIYIYRHVLLLTRVMLLKLCIYFAI